MQGVFLRIDSKETATKFKSSVSNTSSLGRIPIKYIKHQHMHLDNYDGMIFSPLWSGIFTLQSFI